MVTMIGGGTPEVEAEMMMMIMTMKVIGVGHLLGSRRNKIHRMQNLKSIKEITMTMIAMIVKEVTPRRPRNKILHPKRKRPNHLELSSGKIVTIRMMIGRLVHRIRKGHDLSHHRESNQRRNLLLPP